MLYGSSNILGGGLLSTSVVKRVRFIGQETKDNAHQYFKAVRDGIDPAFYAQVVIKGIMVKIAELKDLSL